MGYRRRVSICSWALVLAGFLAARADAAIMFGPRDPPQQNFTGCQGTATQIILDSGFHLSVRNCWNEPVRVLLTLTYHIPGGDTSDIDQVRNRGGARHPGGC
jgi:hypothetical protein